MSSQDRALVEHLAERLGAGIVETHISWVLLLPGFAFKLKKALELPFLDYSTLERRAYFCAEEVRLNRRLSPTLYLGVSRITGPAQAPSLDGEGEVLEYAVRMRRFPPGALFSERLAAGTLAGADVDRLAQRLADFHCAQPACIAGTKPAVPLHERALAALAGAAVLFPPRQRAQLQDWIVREGQRVAPLWELRRAAGQVRECHGDLHLANLLVLDGEVAAFDCIEFDDALRWIDVIEDVAFALMDFCAQGQPALGWRFFNGWLERTGDYEGVGGLYLALVYRALVRAGVEQLRSPGCAAAHSYARAALGWCRRRKPRLLITHGLPGSGKTTRTQGLLESSGAIRIRSDVERKRLHGLAPLADSRAEGLDIYTSEATARTYERLYSLARGVLQAGWPVILDAAFLQQHERRGAQAIAAASGVPFAILECDATPAVLQQRLLARHGDASEADVQVLDWLRPAAQPLEPRERRFVRNGAAAWGIVAEAGDPGQRIPAAPRSRKDAGVGRPS